MENTCFVSIVIPSYNRGSLLVRTIESVFNQIYPKDRFEIVIVDDGSTDDTAERIKGLQKGGARNLLYFYQENKGPAAARNLGIKNSRGNIIVFTDSDCVTSKVWLKEITSGYNNKRVAGVGGIIKAAPTKSIVSGYCAYTRMNELPRMDKTGIVYLITANASFRKECLDLVGGFDKRYTFPGGEDPDLCYRLRERGYYFRYNPDAIVFNPHKNSPNELVYTYFNYGKGESFLILKIKSRWDLISKSGLIWFFYFSKMLLKIILMAIENSITFIFGLIKIPLRVLTYRFEGLNLNISLAYSFLDFIKDISFKQGFFAGYISGKFKGLKRIS